MPPEAIKLPTKELYQHHPIELRLCTPRRELLAFVRVNDIVDSHHCSYLCHRFRPGSSVAAITTAKMWSRICACAIMNFETFGPCVKWIIASVSHSVSAL